MTDRRLLMVSYFFPPVGGIGAQRTVAFATHLPEAGWQPVVIAPRDAHYRVMDPASEAALPRGLEVHRSFCYEPARLRAQLRAAVRGAGRGAGRGPRPDAGAVVADAPGPAAGRRASPAVNAAWARAVRFLLFPDDQVGWVPFAVRSALAVHASSPLQAIYSSSPPISAHLIAGRVKRRTGLPWIADFRDPWVGNSFAAVLSPRRQQRQAELEHWIVRSADRVVFATPGLLERYRDRYPGLGERFAVIPNGYDTVELASIPPPAPRSDARLHLVYAGSVYGDAEMSLFVAGLELALALRPDLRQRLRVEFIGWMTDANRRVAESALPRLAPVLELTGQLPRAEALARLRAADAGLLLLANGPDRDLFVGGKLFEYLGLDRGVLAVAPPGDARRILADLDWGIAADPERESIAAALARLVDSPPPARHADPEGRYDRRHLTARLAGLLDAAVG